MLHIMQFLVKETKLLKIVKRVFPSCDNVAVSDFLNFDISGRRLRLHRISAMAQQQEWLSPAMFWTFLNLIHEI